MMDGENVYSLFRETYGSRGEEKILLPLCLNACAEVLGMASEKADKDDIRLAALAAALVNRRLCLREVYDGDSVTSFKAGDVTVTASPSAILDTAEKEVSSALERAYPLLRDSTFAFRQVKA